jgi:hypothetical protein
MPVATKGFRIVAGEPKGWRHVSPSGGEVTSWFCGDCGARIYGSRDSRPLSINVRAGTLDDTSWLRPVAQIWTSSAQTWALVRDNIISYEEQPTDFAAAFAAAKKLAPRD